MFNKPTSLLKNQEKIRSSLFFRLNSSVFSMQNKAIQYRKQFLSKLGLTWSHIFRLVPSLYPRCAWQMLGSPQQKWCSAFLDWVGEQPHMADLQIRPEFHLTSGLVLCCHSFPSQRSLLTYISHETGDQLSPIMPVENLYIDYRVTNWKS